MLPPGVDCALFELAPRVNALAGHHRDRDSPSLSKPGSPR